MKKIYFFLCGLIMSLSAFAQTSVTVLEPDRFYKANKVLIKERHRDSLSTISCCNSKDGIKDKVTFIYSNSSMQTTEVTIDSFYVNDMVVEKDSVFFCGMHTVDKRGIIGYFKINDVFFNSGQIYIDSGFVAGENGFPITEFTRLIHFYRGNGSSSHIASIGTCDRDFPCLVDFTICSLPMYVSGCVEDRKESFTDLKLVSNSIMFDDLSLVTAGYYNDQNRFINIRVYDANNFFSYTGLQDWCHVFRVDTAYVRPWLDGGVLLANIDVNSFATVSYRDAYLPFEPRNEDMPSIPLTNIHLAFYNLASFASNNVYGMVRHYEIPLLNTRKREMNQFLYNKITKSMSFLHTYRVLYPTSMTHSEYTDFKHTALSASGVIQAYTNNGVVQSGLSIYNNRDNYILSGYLYNTETTLHYQMNTFNTSVQCADRLEYRYEQLNNLSSHNFQSIFIVLGGISKTITPAIFREKLPLFINCEK